MYRLEIVICKAGSRTLPGRTPFASSALVAMRDRLQTFFANRSITVSLVSAEIRNGDIHVILATPETDDWFEDLVERAAESNTYRGTFRLYEQEFDDIIAEGAVTPMGLRGRKYPKPDRGTGWNRARPAKDLGWK